MLILRDSLCIEHSRSHSMTIMRYWTATTTLSVGQSPHKFVIKPRPICNRFKQNGKLQNSWYKNIWSVDSIILTGCSTGFSGSKKEYDVTWLGYLKRTNRKVSKIVNNFFNEENHSCDTSTINTLVLNIGTQSSERLNKIPSWNYIKQYI